MRLLLLAMTILLAVIATADDKQSIDPKDQLSKLQGLVGQWRGVGQPQRSSTKDSWVEQADWAWSFDKGPPSLVATLPKGKYFSNLRLTAAPRSSQYQLSATPTAGGEPMLYSGPLDDQNQLVLTADQPREGFPARLSFRFAAGGDRLLLLLEKPAAAPGQFSRLAEVGYTKQGSGFGKNVTQRECIVTGGLGTIEVTHEGKAYHVCCTGCRDYFNENPQKVLAEYAAKQK